MHVTEARLTEIVVEIDRLRNENFELRRDGQLAVDAAHESAAMWRNEAADWRERHTSLRLALLWCAGIAASGWIVAGIGWWRL